MDEGLRLRSMRSSAVEELVLDGEVRGGMVDAELGRLPRSSFSIFLSKLLTVADDSDRLLGLKFRGRPVIISTFNTIKYIIGYVRLR